MDKNALRKISVILVLMAVFVISSDNFIWGCDCLKSHSTHHPDCPEVQDKPDQVQPSLPVDDIIGWRCDDIDKALTIAGKEKKLILMYFYLKEKEDFPVKCDKNLRKYADWKVVFTKFFVRLNDKSEISDERIRKIHERNKLPKSSGALILDQFGNLIEKISIPVNAQTLTGAFDKAEKTIKEREKILAKQWEKVEHQQKKENKPEMIKELIKIIKTDWQGYEVFINAQKLFDCINTEFTDKHYEIIREYLKINEKERDKDAVILKLQNLLKESSGFPVEALIKETIEKIKKGMPLNIPEDQEEAKGEEANEKEEEQKQPEKDSKESGN
jgi:hypothetical protein